jgi:hypothetical protein
LICIKSDWPAPGTAEALRQINAAPRKPHNINAQVAVGDLLPALQALRDEAQRLVPELIE